MTKESSNYPVEYEWSRMEDEFTLVELWRLVTQSKLVIAVTALICVGIAIAISIFQTKVYESRTAIVIGKIDQFGMIEDPAVMVQRLIEEYRVKDNSEGHKKLPYIDAVSFSSKNTDNVVEIRALGRSSEQASQLLRDMVEKQILKLHAASFERAVSQRRLLIDNLNMQFNELAKFIELMETQEKQIREREPVQASILSIEAGKLLTLKTSLLQQISTLEISLSEIKTIPTTTLLQPTLPIKPKKPRPVLYTALGVVGGLILGVFVALFRNLSAKVRSQTAH